MTAASDQSTMPVSVPSHSRMCSEVDRLAHERDASFAGELWAAFALKALAAALALALVQSSSRRLPRPAGARLGDRRRDHPLRRSQPRKARADGYGRPPSDSLTDVKDARNLQQFIAGGQSALVQDSNGKP